VKIIICLILLSVLYSCTKNQGTELSEQKETLIKACSKEAKMCTGGQVVKRNPRNNCNFDLCPQHKKNTKILCTADVKQCPNGTFVGRDSNNNCQFSPCDDSFL
jgi:hypothetical protein